MKKANITKFSIDLPVVKKEVFNKLIRLGTYEDLGLGTNRWTFPTVNLKDVENTIGERVIFSMKNMADHVLEIDKDVKPDGQILIDYNKDEGSVKSEILKLKDIVMQVLAEDKTSRNSDMWLYFKVLEKKGYVINADYKMITNLPNFKSVGRVRRHIQNVLELYQATPDMIEIRKNNQKDMEKITHWL